MNKIKSILKRIKLIKNWYMFVYPLILWDSGNRVIKMRNGLVIHTRDSKKFTDWATFDEIVLRDVYKTEDFPKEGVHRILDLGANIGVFSLMMAKKYPNAKIIAVEPEESNFEKILKHIETNDIKNVIPICAVVSDKDGFMNLYTGNGNSANHSLYYDSLDFEVNEFQKVRAIELKSLIPADIIKCDIEGAEYDVFKEIPDCKVIVMETHNPKRTSKLMDRFYRKYFVHSDDKNEIHFLSHFLSNKDAN